MARQEIDLTTPQPNGKMGEPTKSAWEKVNDMTLEIYDSIDTVQDKSFISGLLLFWSSGTSLAISSGAAYVEGVGNVYLNSDLSKSLPGLTANSWYHLYLYDNAGTADVEASTTNPSTNTFGSARTKSGDTSRRYIGSFRTTTGGAIVQFQHLITAGKITYLGAAYSVRNVLTGGMAASTTTVSLANLLPIFASSADILITNGATAGAVVTGSSIQALPLAAGATNSYFGYVDPSKGLSVSTHPVDTSRAMQYRYLSTPTGAGLYMEVNGYTFSR